MLGAIVHPGLIDLHYHITQHMIGKMIEEASLEGEDPLAWIGRQYTGMSNALRPEEEQANAHLGALDMLRNGVTFFVEPGTVLDDLRDAAKRHGLTFGPDPSTHDHKTLGGMIGNNSAGTHSVMAGKTVENVASLDILTYDGIELTVGPTGDDELTRVVAEGGRRGAIYRSLRDLRALYTRVGDGGILAAGIPWYVAIFGRDSLIA